MEIQKWRASAKKGAPLRWHVYHHIDYMCCLISPTLHMSHTLGTFAACFPKWGLGYGGWVTFSALDSYGGCLVHLQYHSLGTCPFCYLNRRHRTAWDVAPTKRMFIRF